MEIVETTNMNIDFVKGIKEGKIIPQGVMEAIVWVKEDVLDIQVNESVKDSYNIKEVFVFFWNYENEKAIFIRKNEIVNGHIYWRFNKTLLFQMKYMEFNSVRVAVAIKFDGKYFCGYFRNSIVKEECTDSLDRYICKLNSYDKEAFIAYWTEGGILSLRSKNEKEFDKEFYRLKLVGSKWNNGTLITYIEMPLLEGQPEILVKSMTTKEVFLWNNIKLQEQGFSGIKRVFRVDFDMTGIVQKYDDAYYFICKMGGYDFEVFADNVVGANEDIHTITLETGENMDVVVVREKNGLFTLQLAEKIYPVMLSVVTAVYNTEPFLAEMINSVLFQNTKKIDEYIIGNIAKDYRNRKYQNVFEFILVDDGSTDGSSKILDDYAEISNRIKIIHKENEGVSSARNAGIDVARGKYITFPDSDDKLSENYFSESISFFEDNESSLSVVATPIKLFDAREGEHWANYKFSNNNRVIDLKKEPDAVLYTVNSSFIKRKSLERERFNTQLRRSEDALLINDIIINERKMLGTVGKVCYWYRKRSEGEKSAMEKSKFTEDGYISSIENVYEKLLLNGKREYGFIPKFIQYTVMGQLQWQFASNDKGVRVKQILGDLKYIEYKEKLFTLLKCIDDDVILAQKKLWSEHYFYLLQHKYGKKPNLVLEDEDVSFYFENCRIPTTLGKNYVQIDFMCISNGILHIEGFGMDFMPEAELIIYVNDIIVRYEQIPRDINKYSLDDVVLFATTFTVDIELTKLVNQDEFEICFSGKLSDIEVPKKNIRYSKGMPLSEIYMKSYYMCDGWAIRRNKEKLIVYNLRSPNSTFIDFEYEFINEVENSKNAQNLSDIMIIRRAAMNWMARKKANRKIWLLSDRADNARDSAEAMFRFICQQKDPDIDAYYVINEDAMEYPKMREIGKTVSRGSQKHLLLRLMADYIVSSAADDIVINPWIHQKDKTEVVKDLLAKSKFIYLKHGVVISDMSKWLSRYNKNITAIICAALREKQSFLDYEYHYKMENIWLTGLPRHDRLYHDEKRYITIMPTWRKWLRDTSENNRPGKCFTESDYYKFYNTLINDQRLLSYAEQYHYTICFMPHPNIQSVIDLFVQDKRVKFFALEKPYNEVLAESNLVITDYSSVSVDFALMRKPIVYCQFDEKQFFEDHTYKHGYFKYVEDGFGEVTYDMDSLVNVVISYIKDGCKVHEPYGSRMDNFFAFHDHNNCERVYKKIRELAD